MKIGAADITSFDPTYGISMVFLLLIEVLLLLMLLHQLFVRVFKVSLTMVLSVCVVRELSRILP
jgi:hypothetical protein